MRLAIGIDLGGTTLRGGLCDQQGQILELVEQPSLTHRTADDVLADVIAAIKALQEKADQSVAQIGCGIPGLIDHTTGIVHKAPHIPEWNNYPIQQKLSEGVGQKICIDNDANYAALGERRFGAGQGRDNLLMLTLGTGIGGGMIIDGKIHHGDCGFAAEVGHLVISPDGPSCPCGGAGCWELFGSAKGVKRLLKEASLDWTLPELAEAAEQDDQQAQKVWQQYGTFVGSGIASLVNALGIHHVIVGGGISSAWKHFSATARATFKRHTYPKIAEITKIVSAQLGNDAGILGAAWR